jgi:hypothetical protein
MESHHLSCPEYEKVVYGKTSLCIRMSVRNCALLAAEQILLFGIQDFIHHRFAPCDSELPVSKNKDPSQEP